MEEPRVQSGEAGRLAALDALDLLDTPGEPRFDRITRVAQRHFRVNIALVSLVGADRVWFKSKQGIDLCDTQRAASFCERAILSEGVFSIQDAIADPLFAGNPLVTGPPHIRFYAGAPLHAPGGQRIGTLCIMGDAPRAMSRADDDMLLDLAAIVDEEVSKGILIVQGQALALARRLEEVITRAQSEFIAAEDRSGAFQGLLDDLLALTDSQYGFIGEVLGTPDGAPYLKTYAITDISWDSTTRGFYGRDAPKGMEFANLDTLFGAVLEGGDPVIANDPVSDPRRGGLPTGHPPLDSFLGVPVFHAGEMVAMFGLANRPGGYDPSVIDFLRPLTATLGQLVYAARIRALHIEGERSLRFIIDGTRIGTWEWNVQTGETAFNERWAEIVGYTLAELAPVSIQTWLDLAHPDDLQECNGLLETLRTAGRYSGHEKEYIRKDGTRYPVLLNGMLVRDSTGRKLIWSIIEDISEQKALLQQTERQRDSLHSLLDQLQIGTRSNSPGAGATGSFSSNARFVTRPRTRSAGTSFA
jgi:PAS domain S-box-containing protein